MANFENMQQMRCVSKPYRDNYASIDWGHTKDQDTGMDIKENNKEADKEENKTDN